MSVTALETLVTLTADIVAAHVSNNAVSVADMSSLIANVHAALSILEHTSEPAGPAQEPAISVRSSVKPDYIVCLEDGKKLKTLKRHLMTKYSMTPADYRAKWNLPADYPMTAPNYTQQRKELALKIGLGRKSQRVIVEQPTKAPVKRARRPKAVATSESA